ncbi:MAG: pitrilysin family protein, partial [Candidatus Sumerlaeota bacterium]|nr:pitrilysin family protein [Candidatus Sumerlaeota bacterium]
LDLADAMNRLGGHFNAFTSQEALCVHARLIDRQLAAGLDLLAEVVLRSTFAEEELQRERNVIIEEYKMIDDTPDDLVIDLFHEALWGEEPIGRPVIGRLEALERLRREDLVEHARRAFAPGRLIVSAAGALDEKAILAQVEDLFGGLQPAESAAPSATRPAGAFERKVRDKDIEQVQFCFGCLGPPRADEDRYRFSLLTSIIGGGMSSRVFKEVREKRGLAYSIGSYVTAFHDTGGFAIAGGTSPETLGEVVDLCVREIRGLYSEGARGDELDLAKEQMKASLLFALENTGSRMTRLAEQEIYFGRFFEIDEVLRQIDAVTETDIREVAEQRLRDARVAVAAVGPAESNVIDLDKF